MDKIINVKEKELKIRDAKILIKPLKVRQYGKVLKNTKIIDAIMNNIKTTEGVTAAILPIVGEHYEEIVDLVTVASDFTDKDAVEDLELHELVMLVEAILEVNIDSFLSLVLPKLEGFGERMNKKTKVGKKKAGAIVSKR